MKRVICLVLALILCMMLPMSAFAATKSPEGGKAPVYTGSDNPKTGDINNMEIWVPILVISAIALVVLAVIYFKKFRKSN